MFLLTVTKKAVRKRRIRDDTVCEMGMQFNTMMSSNGSKRVVEPRYDEAFDGSYSTWQNWKTKINAVGSVCRKSSMKSGGEAGGIRVESPREA